MDIMNVVRLCDKGKMMRCMLVFSCDDKEAITKQTCEILATRNIVGRDCVVEIRKGTCDVLTERKHI